MELMADDPTDMIVFQPQELVERDDNEPTMPPAPRGEATLEELHREMEKATGPWLRVLIGAVGEATRKRGAR